MNSFSQGTKNLLILGRVSNLPTVWSNLLAGMILAGQWEWPSLPILMSLLLGGTFLYVGGMYLNDFCDADFDLRHCPTRPIPAGRISRRSVGILTTLWFIAGLACLLFCGLTTFLIGLLLLGVIVIYDCWHKDIPWAPLVMGGCRLLLYPLAASIFINGAMFNSTNTVRILLGVIPVAIPLALYVAGITYLARGESRPRKPSRWALVLLLLPVAFACSTYFNLYLPDSPLPILPVILICLLQLYWMAWLLIPLWRKTKPSIGRVVSGLLAGIVLVDMIALIPLVGPLGIVLFPLFVLALLLQRFVPAT